MTDKITDNMNLGYVSYKGQETQLRKLAIEKFGLEAVAMMSNDDVCDKLRKEVYGEIDNEHPLVIFTAFVPDFAHKDIESVFEHKENLEMHCKQPFTYVCFTNEISTKDAQERGLDVIPFSSKNVKNDRSLWKNEMTRKNVKMPKDATSIWIDISQKFDKEFEVVRGYS